MASAANIPTAAMRCGTIEVGGCRDHRGLTWVAGHYEREMGRHGRGNRVWVDAHWERLEVAHR
ncbi:MAG: hypothetical protein IPI48_18020 [bacterium]|nr:hypothetical protein [bacterium]